MTRPGPVSKLLKPQGSGRVGSGRVGLGTVGRFSNSSGLGHLYPTQPDLTREIRPDP